MLMFPLSEVDLTGKLLSLVMFSLIFGFSSLPLVLVNVVYFLVAFFTFFSSCTFSSAFCFDLSLLFKTY